MLPLYKTSSGKFDGYNNAKTRRRPAVDVRSLVSSALRRTWSRFVPLVALSSILVFLLFTFNRHKPDKAPSEVSKITPSHTPSPTAPITSLIEKALVSPVAALPVVLSTPAVVSTPPRPVEIATPRSPVNLSHVIPIQLRLDSGPFVFSVPDPLGKTPGEEEAIWLNRSANVVEAFRHAWDGYVKNAWGSDELHPLSEHGSQWFHLGLTAVDALDTAWILGQQDVFEKAKEWVVTGLKFDADVDANVFEITIRVLGSLLSTFHLSGDKIFLNKAVELAELLQPAFTTPSKIPLASINFSRKSGVMSTFNMGASSTAEATTLQMEFKFLAWLTQDPKWWNLVQAISKVIENSPDKWDGLVPIFISPETGRFVGDEIRLGSRGDSYYEYLAKQWLLSNKTEWNYRKEHEQAVAGIKKHLLGVSTPNHYVFVGERPSKSSSLSPKMDHLVCFLPAALAVAATGGRRVPSDPKGRAAVLTPAQMEDLALAEDLMRSCYEIYRQTPTGLAPEIVYWRASDEKWEPGTRAPDADEDDAAEPAKELQDYDIHTFDRHNLLRPETVESLFTLYRITGKRKYRTWGWRIFRAFQKWTRVEKGGYTSLDNVVSLPPPTRDKMETFFLGETLKYLYLLFADESIIPLDQYVFNTEAHPFPIFHIDESLRAKLDIVGKES